MQTKPKNQKTLPRFQIINHIKNLSHSQKAIRREAEIELQHLGDAALPLLIECFEHERELADARNRVFKNFATVLEFVAGCGFFIGIIAWRHYNNLYLNGILFLSIALFFGCNMLLDPTAERLPMRLGAAFRFLMEMDSQKVIETLLKRYTLEQIGQNAEVLALLEGHIVQMTPTYWNNVTPEQRKKFYCIVKEKSITDCKKSQKFALTGLKALERIGDSSAITTVEHIAKYGKSAKLRAVAKGYVSRFETLREEG